MEGGREILMRGIENTSGKAWERVRYKDRGKEGGSAGRREGERRE